MWESSTKHAKFCKIEGLHYSDERLGLVRETERKPMI